MAENEIVQRRRRSHRRQRFVLAVHEPEPRNSIHFMPRKLPPGHRRRQERHRSSASEERNLSMPSWPALTKSRLKMKLSSCITISRHKPNMRHLLACSVRRAPVIVSIRPKPIAVARLLTLSLNVAIASAYFLRHLPFWLVAWPASVVVHPAARRRALFMPEADPPGSARVGVIAASSYLSSPEINMRAR